MIFPSWWLVFLLAFLPSILLLISSSLFSSTYAHFLLFDLRTSIVARFCFSKPEMLLLPHHWADQFNWSLPLWRSCSSGSNRLSPHRIGSWDELFEVILALSVTRPQKSQDRVYIILEFLIIGWVYLSRGLPNLVTLASRLLMAGHSDWRWWIHNQN